MFAWLGLLVVGFAVAAWARRRRPDAGWKPRPMPTDRISRPGRAAAIVFFVLGMLVLINPAWLIRAVSGGRAAPAAYQAFAYDEGFLRLRGPVVLGLMIAGLILLAILLCQGRWRPWIRQADMAHSLVVCIVLTWAVAAGPIFKATPTDRAVKGAASLIILVTLIDLAVRTRRQPRPASRRDARVTLRADRRVSDGLIDASWEISFVQSLISRRWLWPGP